MTMRPGKRRQLEPEGLEYLAEKLKASVRAKSLPSTAVGGGASLPECEAGVQLREGKLSRLGEEHAATGIAAGVGQPDDSGASTGGLTWRPAGPNPSVGRLGTRYSPAGGENHQWPGQEVPHIQESRPKNQKTGRATPCSEYP